MPKSMRIAKGIVIPLHEVEGLVDCEERSAAIDQLKQEAAEADLLEDYTRGRSARSLVVTKTGSVCLSPVRPTTLVKHLGSTTRIDDRAWIRTQEIIRIIAEVIKTDGKVRRISRGARAIRDQAKGNSLGFVEVTHGKPGKTLILTKTGRVWRSQTRTELVAKRYERAELNPEGSPCLN